MKRSYVLLGVLGVVLVCAGIGVSAVFAEEEVSLDQVPDAVRATLLKQAGGAKIVEIEMEEEDGQVVYEAEVIIDGREVDLLVSPTGEFLGTESDDDEDGDHDGDDDGREEEEDTVQWNQLPQAVQGALSQTLPGVTFDELTREVEDGFVAYEASYTASGAECSVKLTEDGSIVEMEEEISAADLPADVAAAVANEFPGASIEEAELVHVTLYELEISANGKTREVKVLANGSILGDDDDDDDDDD